MRYAPHLTGEAFVADVLAKASRAMAERAFLWGGPAAVAGQRLTAADDRGVRGAQSPSRRMTCVLRTV
jgi:hypothetical protein